MTLHEMPHIPLRNERGAFDLPSILIGVVVVAVLTAGVLAAVFGAIPFAQEDGAKQDLSSVRTAQGVQLTQGGAYLDKAALEASGTVSPLPSAMQIFDSRGGAGYCASNPTPAGKTFIITGQNSQVREGTCDVTWTKASTVVSASDALGLAASADGMKLLYAPHFGGTLRRSTDSGLTWTTLTSAGTGYWGDLASSADGTTLVALSSASLRISTDSGSTWVERAMEGTTSLRSVAMSSDGSKIIVASDSGSAGIATSLIFTSTDSGSNWTTRNVTEHTTHAWMDLGSSADGSIVYAAETHQNIFKSNDAGVTWTKVPVPSGNLWRSMAVSADGTRVVATAYKSTGVMWRSSDSGATWIMHDFASQDIGGVDLSPDGSTIITTPDAWDSSTLSSVGIPVISTDFGVTWKAQDSLDSAVWKFPTISADGSRFHYISAKAGLVYSAQFEY